MSRGRRGPGRPATAPGAPDLLDGVAWHGAERLAADGRLAGADLRCCHQLTPERAEDLSQAGRVVFVDACVGPTPGSVQWATVRPSAEYGGAPWSHGLTPASLAALCAAVSGPETEGPDDAGTFGPVIVTIASPSFPTGRANLQEGPEG